MDGFFYWDWWVYVLLLLVVVIALPAGVRGLWAAWRAVWAWRVEQERARIETERQRADQALIRPDPLTGLLPVHRLAIEGATDAILSLMAARIATMQPPSPAPHSIHYAPHIASVQPPMAMAQIEAPSVEPVNIPTFAELLSGGNLGNGRFLLGCDLETGRAITGAWKELYSTALGGMSGTGKSTTARFLLAQAALNGCRFVVLDPHAGAGEDSLAATLAPLSASMLCSPASSDTQILDAARYVDSMGRKRIEGDPDRSPVIVCIDEATALLSRSTVGGPLGELIETIAQEYRKVNIFALCSAQIWLAGRSGGSSALRDSFASAYVHRMKRNQARLLLPTDDARQVETLATGQAVLWRTSGETGTVVIPNTTVADVEAVALRTGVRETAPNQLSTLENRAFGGDQPKADSTSAFDAKALRVITAFEAGQTLRQIASEVYEVSGGANYNAALAEIQNVLRDHLYRLKRGTNGHSQTG